jgi:hypothetical protein
MFCHFFQQKNWEFFLKTRVNLTTFANFWDRFAEKYICQKSEETSNWNPAKSFYFQKMIFRFSLSQNLAYSKRLMRLKMLTFHQQQEWLWHFLSKQ